MNLFYTPAFFDHGSRTAPAPGSRSEVLLDPEERKHISKSLRMRPGDLMHLTDGRGSLCRVRLLAYEGRTCKVEVLESHVDYRKRAYILHMAVAPTKNLSRYEWFLEKAAEIGVDKVTPLICEKSVRRKINQRRAVKILISAMKQSGQAYLCAFNSPATLHGLLHENEKAGAQKIIASYEEGNPDLAGVCLSGKDTLILIGPEGDFTSNEVDAALGAGFKQVNLSMNRLRTETAGVAACQTIATVNGGVREWNGSKP